MDWFEAYKEETDRIFMEAAAEAKLLPEPLAARGLELIAHCSPLQRPGATNYISYLLPFWIRDRFEVDSDLCRDIAVGNIFAMLHFSLLDDAMDDWAMIKGKEVRQFLVLSELFHRMFERRYFHHFPADSSVWNYYQNYLADWAAAIYNEGDVPVDPRNPQQLARKSAPVKLGAAALLLKAGREDRIPDMEEAVDLALATLQLADDWADWRDDLADPNNSAFLMLVRQQLPHESEVLLDERTVKEAVYRHHCLGLLTDIADSFGSRMKEIPDLPGMLSAFQQSLAEGIRNDARLAEQSTESLASGGLSYFLSKINTL